MQLIPDEMETIAGAARALRAGQVTSLDLVERCLARIGACESQIHAWVSVDREGARLRARELDAEARAGRWRGPLHGIPIGVKDMIDMAGLATGAGSRQMAQNVAQSDATVVGKLREAGAVFLGKTVTTQFACFDPPPTRNPWNTDRTPGGSSSGSSAATAAAMCLGAIGSQTGGSITRPATYCGVAGCKPSYGRVSLSGIVPLAPSFDHPGPIARRVVDLAILLNAIAGYDPADPHSANVPPLSLDWFPTAPRFASPPKMARLGGFFETLASESALAAFDSSLGRLQSCGAVVVEAAWPETFAEVHAQHRVIFEYEIAHWHQTRFREYRDDYLPGLASLVEKGLKIPESTYHEAKQHQARAWQEIETVFGDAAVLVCPATRSPAPDLTTTGDPAFNSPWSYTGLPTVSFPIGLSPDGLPLGIQFVGRRYDECRLLQTALWCEERGGY